MSQSLVSAPAMLANGSEPHHSSPRAKSSPLVRTSSSSSAASPKGAASSPSSSSPQPPQPPSSASRAAKLVASPSLSQPTVSSQQVHAHRQQQQQQQQQQQAQPQPNGLAAIKATSNGVPSFPSPPSSSSSPPPPPSSSGPLAPVKLLTQPSVRWPHWLSEPVSALAKDIEQDMLEIESPPPFPLAIVFQHHERPGQAPAQTTLAQRDGLTLRISDFCHEAGYREWSRLMEVAPLASQHHMSRYNQLKFGCNGSPFTYVPMTLQSPSQSKAAMDRQLDNERRALDWLVEKRKRARQVAARARQEQQELARAKSRQSRDHGPMSPESESTTVGGLKRRSSNAVASFLSDSDGDSHMRGTSPFSTAAAAAATTTPMATPVTSLPSGSSSLHDNNTVKIKGPVNDVETVAAEWEKPVGNELAYHQQPANASAVSSSGTVAAQIESTTLQQVQEEQRPATISAMAPQQQQALAVKTSDTHPIHISPIIPPEHLASISTKVLEGLPACVKTHFANSIAVPKDAAELAGGSIFDLNFDNDTDSSSSTLTNGASQTEPLTADPSRAHADGQVQGKRLIRCRTAGVNLREVAEQVTEGDWTCQDAYKSANNCLSAPEQGQPGAQSSAASSSSSPSSPSSPAPPTMGNLLLSSCPGKKVRLTGPVRGRGAICRDLGLDLQRFRQMGIGAIVCCLDDEELSFLGAPWESYEREADSLGLDVIRLPMAEGFAPTSVETADAAITSLVSDYTLQGVHVLVHCRGGVGRAGLIACIWMLKLGLVWEAPRQAPFFMQKHLYKVTPRGQYLRWDRHTYPHGVAPGIERFEVVGEGMPPRETAEAKRQMDQYEWRYSRTMDVMGCNETLCALVDTIRMRRSLKAIETAEQVHFLARYIEYLCLQEQHLLEGAPQT